MMIACDSCQSKYSVADEKVLGKTVRIRCRECQATIVVTGSALSTPPPASAVYQPQFSAKSSDAPAAIVKRGGARVNRDFVAETRSAEPAFDRPTFGATAQRNENSVLFTLAGLTRKPLVADKPAEATTANSGLIDLNGMTAATGGGSYGSVIQPVFGSSPPFGPVTMEVDQALPPPPNRRNLFIAIGATAALLTLVALGFGMSGGSSESKSAAAGAPIAAAPAPLPAVTPKPAEPVAVPVPVAESTPASSSSSGSATPASTGRGKKAKKAGGSFVVKAQKAPKATHASGKPHGGSDACGCNGELMCLMRCSK